MRSPLDSRGSRGSIWLVDATASGKVYVTDRENSRIQVLNSTGKFLKQWVDVGAISALFITKDQQLWAGCALYDLTARSWEDCPAAWAGTGSPSPIPGIFTSRS